MRFSRWMVAPVAAAALIAAGSAAVAASGSAARSTNGPASAFWSAVASKVGVPASTLESAVRSVAQKDLQSGMRVLPRIAGRRGAFRVRVRSTFGVRRAFLKTAADYLGITPTKLLSDLRSGQSLAQVATASGKSVSGLEAALSARATQAIDQLVQHTWTPRGGNGAASSAASSAG